MSKEKQIEEMAKIVCNACEMGGGFDGECDIDNDYKTCGNSVETAEALYTAGYRKASEVAEEIFAEIERLMLDGAIGGKYPIKVINPSKYAELKKKYTESEDK